ncbi:MAG TPA: hypothetical protein VFG79_23055 [Solirubrobacter sp.]|nr:hypothetical protein [Solirubrobacter sp.]
MASDRPLLPAVLQLRVWAAAMVTLAIALLAVAVAGWLDLAEMVIGIVVAGPIFFGGMWLLIGRRFVGEVVAAARETPPGTEIAPRRTAVLLSVALLAPVLVLVAVLVVIAPPVVGGLVGVANYWLALAGHARRWERETGRPLRHRRLGLAAPA